MEYSNWFVVAMGLGVVFLGLVVLILLVTAMSGVMRKITGKDEQLANVPKINNAAPMAAGGRVTPEVIAAIGAAVAEEMGTDVNAIRIVSCKRV